MQRIEGIRLRDILDQKAPLPKSFGVDSFFEKLHFFIEIMHKEKNIYHRDIHAGNIMVENLSGVPYVIDFGNSRRMNAREIKQKVDPYYIEIKGKPFNLLDDFEGLEKTKEETKNFLTNR